MISEETTELLQKLLAEQPTYRPKDEILRQIGDINFICFVSATCMGKTTLMDALVADDPRFGKTRNFTSRPPRPDDDPKRYYYYEHSDEGLRPLFDRIESRTNLQHNINPFTLQVYGSEASDYPHVYNMGDIFSSSIDGFRQLGFGKLWVFSVVTDPVVWQARFNDRFPAGHPHREARLKEAVMSLEWSLAETASDHTWVISPEKHVEVAVTSVENAIRGEKTDDQAEARQLAEECLKRAKELLRAI